jgi:hypothetical protein
MTVKELIEKLKQFPEDYPVVISANHTGYCALQIREVFVTQLGNYNYDRWYGDCYDSPEESPELEPTLGVKLDYTL